MALVLGSVPHATQIYDFYPAAEHLKKTLNAAYGEGSEEALRHFRRLRQTLLDDELGASSGCCAR